MLHEKYTTSLQCPAWWTTGLGFTGWDRVTAISAPSRQRAHGQRVLLINSIQLFCAHSVSDEVKLLRERLAAVRHTDIGDVGATDVVAFRTLLGITGAQPVTLGLESVESSVEATWVGSSDTSKIQKENTTSDWQLLDNFLARLIHAFNKSVYHIDG